MRERFLGDFEAALVRIEENPFLYQTVRRAIRRAPLGDFPYGIFYVQVRDEIRILGVVHMPGILLFGVGVDEMLGALTFVLSAC